MPVPPDNANKVDHAERHQPTAVMRLFGRSIRDCRRALADLFLFHFLFEVVAFVLLTPPVAWLFRQFVSSSGNSAVGNADIARFLLTPFGLTIALLLASLYCTISFCRFAGLMTIGSAIADDRRVTYVAALKFILTQRLSQILKVSLGILLVIAVTLLPFLLAALLTANLLLTQHDINFYLDAHPQEFLIAIGIGLLLIVLAAITLALVSAPFVFVLPQILFCGVSARVAFRESRQLGKSLGFGRIAKAILTWLAATTVASMLLNAVIQLLGGIVVRLAATNVGTLLAALGGVASISLMSNYLLSLAASAVGCLFVVHLHRHACRQCGIETVAVAAHSSAIGDEQIATIPAKTPLICAVAALLVAALVAYQIMEDLQFDDHVDISAHRGASLAAPENTLSAVKRAIEDGATYVEFDVQRTADGVIVVNHDADLMRVARSPVIISESTYEELREIDVGSLFGQEFQGERMPTLEEVIDTANGKIKLIVELKSYKADASLLVADVLRILKERDMSSTAVIMSLEYSEVEEVERLAPEFESGFVASVALGDISQLKADFLAISKANATNAFVGTSHANGKQVFVWTVDDPDEMSTMIDRGVDNIITNDPAAAVRVLRERASLSNAERILLRFKSLYID